MSKPASKLDSLFCPKSIAVVGASTRPGTAGNDILRNLLFAQLNGSVYPVNPKADSVFGVHCYPTLSDIPYEVEQAIIIIPAKAVLGAIDQAIAKGVKSVVVISAGFKEIGGEGAKIEAQLRDKVRAAGISLIGPNCLGVINTDPEVRMNGAFGKKMPAEGNLAFVSQSGALCASVLDYAEQRGIGFSKFISFGNKADVNEVDLLEYLATDDKTAVITMYLEDITDGPRFIKKVREISWNTRKPILCLKSGRS
ncbi:MAG: CoA-binding protein, partial [Thermoguttaceae bacterium]